MTRVNLRVATDAAAIVDRLRDTADTLAALMREYRCAYPTIKAAILSQITLDQWHAIARRKLGQGGVAGRFPPGNVPWTAGRKGIRLSPATEFQAGTIRGNAARRYRAVGSIVIRKGKRLSTQERARHGQSSRWIKVRDEGPLSQRYIPYARYLWEKAHGPVPAGKIVAHRDNRSMNDDPSNLILIDRAELMKRLYDRPAVIATCRAKAAHASKQRHAKARAAKTWSRQQQRQSQIVWDCDACGTTYGEPVSQCTKCGSTAMVERRILPMPDSMTSTAEDEPAVPEAVQ
jgi:hypothetical protein